MGGRRCRRRQRRRLRRRRRRSAGALRRPRHTRCGGLRRCRVHPHRRRGGGSARPRVRVAHGVRELAAAFAVTTMSAAAAAKSVWRWAAYGMEAVCLAPVSRAATPSYSALASSSSRGPPVADDHAAAAQRLAWRLAATYEVRCGGGGHAYGPPPRHDAALPPLQGRCMCRAGARPWPPAHPKGPSELPFRVRGLMRRVIAPAGAGDSTFA